MSIAARRGVGIAGLLGLLAGALVLMTLPGDPGALRLAGVSLLWWYGAIAAPLAAVLLAVNAQRVVHTESAPDGSVAPSVAAWASPVILALVAARVVAGAPDAPAIALAALVAPLVALLGAGDAPARPNIVASLATGAGIGLILLANLLLLGDVGGSLGLPRWAASAAAGALGLLVVALRAGAGRYRLPLLAGAGGLGFLALVALVALTTAVTPWSAWRDVASRPALTFGARDPWVTQGRTLAAPTTLEFTEAHRVTALTGATFRIFEPDRFRESQLRAGESVALRPGDRLAVDAGTRLRFEAGKRVPGSPASGVTWADPPERRALSTVADALGVAVTLVGGALALATPARRVSALGMSTGSGLLLVLILGALCLGVYGVHSAAGIGIGAPVISAVFDIPAAVAPGVPGRALVVLTAGVLLLLFAATVAALRDVLAVATADAGAGEAPRADARPPIAGPIMTFLLVVTCVASLWSSDASQALLIGLGLTASAAAVPRLGRRSPRARLAGSLVGVVAFAGLAALGPRLPAWADVVATYPVLAAAPLAWGAGRAWEIAAAPRR
jgi:hypothetical protein